MEFNYHEWSKLSKSSTCMFHICCGATCGICFSLNIIICGEEGKAVSILFPQHLSFDKNVILFLQIISSTSPNQYGAIDYSSDSDDCDENDYIPLSAVASTDIKDSLELSRKPSSMASVT